MNVPESFTHNNADEMKSFGAGNTAIIILSAVIPFSANSFTFSLQLPKIGIILNSK